MDNEILDDKIIHEIQQNQIDELEDEETDE